jgi:DNA-binding transcriptional LysR family regulator
MLNLYKLEVFVYAVEEGSFSGAAERLLMTQSGVSQHIRDLEATLGAQLFERGRRGVHLTRAGEKLYDYARRILALVAEAENAVTDVANLDAGQTCLGATPGVSVYLLADPLQAYLRHYPKLTVTVQTRITPEIVADLLAGRLDIGIIEGELDPAAEQRLGVHLLQTIDQNVVVGKRHRFWSRDELTLSELDGELFIMRQPGSQTRIWLDAMLRQNGVRPQIGGEFDTLEAIKRAVAGGSSLTILPGYAVRDEVELGLLRAIPLEGSPLQRTLKLIWDKRRPFSPVTRSLLVFLQQTFPALAEVV